MVGGETFFFFFACHSCGMFEILELCHSGLIPIRFHSNMELNDFVKDLSQGQDSSPDSALPIT